MSPEPGETLSQWRQAATPAPTLFPGLAVRPAPFGGHECYATQPIPAGAIIAVSVGVVKLGPDMDDAVGRHFSFHIENGFYLHPVVLTPDWYINHSCDPNAGGDEAFTTRAMRDIAPGEAITTDYGLEEADGFRPFDCRCGASQCRKRIRW